ncbi:DNA methyltransferase [Bradyrhizobium sp. PMVTL-01]|uniref:DNA methyltransferase n=1 Tax=Bradyrhizobium sp. PMVTL-01 TaxID=3434999 RepID=UPI003F7074E4
MNRTEHLSDRVTLYLADAREALREIPNIGDIVSDPPYGISYMPGSGGRFTARGGTTVKRTWENRRGNVVKGDDVAFDPTFLLTCPARHRILWGANNYASRLPDRQGWLFWDKYCAPSKLTFAEGEMAWTDLPITAKAFRHLWNGVCKASETGQARLHPTQKPIALMAWCISLLPPSEKAVVDPFMGCGTTGLAAVDADRPFVGIELEQKYFDLACRRIAGRLKQARLAL